MKITFIKDCPPIIASGNSAYKAGDEADLRDGKKLISLGYARADWGAIPDPEPEPAKPAPKRRTRKAATKK